MTKITTKGSKKIFVPHLIPNNSPLLHSKSDSLADLRENLQLKGGSEVEIRFVTKNNKAVNRINGKKTNTIIANFIESHYPEAIDISFESSANMIELDTGLCSSYPELIGKLKYIQHIKLDILKTFGLCEGTSRVSDDELGEAFCNPIDDDILSLIIEMGYEKALQIIECTRSEYQKQTSGYKYSPMNRIEYLLEVHKCFGPSIANYTKTTSQQLTLSSSDHNITLWLHAQLLNTIYQHFDTHNNFQPRTQKRGEQRKKVVDFRVKHKLGINSGYEPKFPGSDYRKYFKTNYFPNTIKDNYRIGDLNSFVMSHGPQSNKYSINEEGNPIPRTEFRLQDSGMDTIKAHSNIELLFQKLLHSQFKNFPMYDYDIRKK